MSTISVGAISTVRNISVAVNPQGGKTVTTTHEGTQSAMEALMASLQPFAPGTSASLSQSQPPKWELVIISPEEIFTVFEVVGNDIEIDKYQTERAIALGNSVLTAVRAAVKAFEDGDVTDYRSRLSPPDAQALYDCLISGDTHSVHSQYVLRVTQVIAGRYSGRLIFKNIERIYTTSQLESEQRLPDTALFSISDISDSVTPTTTIDGTLFGWLKKTPSINQIASGRFVVVQEYWLSNWRLFDYYQAT